MAGGSEAKDSQINKKPKRLLRGGQKKVICERLIWMPGKVIYVTHGDPCRMGKLPTRKSADS
jgi:hypothetical protein